MTAANVIPNPLWQYSGFSAQEETLTRDDRAATATIARRDEFSSAFAAGDKSEEIDEVVDTLRSGWITTGPKTKRFETEFGEYVGCEHAIAVSSSRPLSI